MLYLKIKRTMMGVGFIAVSILLLTVANTVWAGCPASTVSDMKGVKAGKYPQQYELAEFEKLAGCKMTFQGNPDIARLNGKIRGSPSSVPSVANRLPSEPLVYAPYESIGKYGGTLDVPVSYTHLTLPTSDLV